MRIGLFFAVASLCHATTYYVSPQGSDSNNGLTGNNAWATVTHVDAQTFSPGDIILFQRGATWKDAAITPGQSGSAGNPITFGAWGLGALPIIDNTAVESGFTLTSGNVWQKSVVFTPPTPRQVFFDSLRGTPQSSQGALATNNDWFYNSGTNILYVYSTTNPSGKLIEASVRENGLVINTKSYISATNLAVNRAGSHGIEISTGDHITLTGMNAALNGQDGVSIEQGSSNVSVSGGTLANNGAISGGDNNGIGTGGLGAVSSPITISGVEIYGSGNDNIEIYGPAGTTVITVSQCYLHGGSAGGIRLSGPGTVNATLTYNNIANTLSNGIIVGTAGVNVSVYNNTVTGNAAQGFYLFAAGTANVRNNILSQNGGNTGYEIERDAGTLTSDYNDVYHPANLTQQVYFQGSGNGQSFASWKTNTGQDAHSPGNNPLLNAYFSLQAGSPAFNAGVVIGGVTVANPPNIGSFLTQIPVSISSTTQTQAVMQIRGFSGACTLVVSESKGGPTIPDTDGTEYSGASTDTGRADTITTADGLLRTVTIGHQNDDRALANNTPYYYAVSGCGSAYGSFVTANLSSGTTRTEQSPFNAAKWGNLGLPTLNWTSNVNKIVDPLTGANMQTMAVTTQTYRLGGGTTLGSGFNAFTDWAGGTGWTSPANVLNGSTSTASTANTNVLDLYADLPNSSNGPVAYNYTRTFEDLGIVVYGDCVSCTGAPDKIINICIIFDAPSGCVSNTLAVTLGTTGSVIHVSSGSTDPDGAFPSAFPTTPFFGWTGTSVPLIRMENQEGFGFLNASGSALSISTPTANNSVCPFPTTVCGSFYSPLATGSRIHIPGSGCGGSSASADLCTFATVTNAATATVVENVGTLTAVSFRAYGWGIRVWKNTAVGTAKIGLNYKYGGSLFPMQTGSGGDKCSHVQVTSGDGLNGFMCETTAGLPGAGHAVFISTGGVTRILSNNVFNVGFDPTAGNTVYQGIINGSGGWGVSRLVYGGDYTTGLAPVNDYACAPSGTCPAFNDQFVPTDLMPHGGSDLDEQVTALQGTSGRLPAYSFTLYGHWTSANSNVHFVGTTGHYAIFDNVYSGQGAPPPGGGGGPGWMAVVDIATNPAVLIELCHTLDGGGCANARFSTLHSVQDAAGRENTMFISANVANTRNTSVLFGGPWVGVPEILESTGPLTWSGTSGGAGAGSCLSYPMGTIGTSGCASATYVNTCQTAVGFTCNPALWPTANGTPYLATDLVTLRFADGGPCSTFATAAEIALSPCPSAPSTAGHYPAMQVGDNTFEYDNPSHTCNGNPCSPGAKTDWGHMRVLEGPINGGSCGTSKTCYLMVNNAMPVTCSFSPWQGLTNPDAQQSIFQLYHENGWTLGMAPGLQNTCGGAALYQDLPSANVQELGPPWDVHFATGNGITGGSLNLVTITHTQFNVPFTSMGNVPQVFVSTPDLTWNGNGGAIPAYLQSYTDNSQFTAGPSGIPWAVDMNASVGCTAETIGCGPLRTLTHITGDTYTITTVGTSSASEATYKSQPMIGYAGRYQLKDISGPSSLVDSTPFSMCFVLTAGECHAASSANTVYVNVPHDYDAPLAGGFCQPGLSWANVACVWFGANAPASGMRQFRISQNDPTGQYSRWISNGWSSVGRQYPFSHATAYPLGNQLLAMGTNNIDGFDSVGMMISMPPWVERQDPGNVYRTIPVKIPAGHAAASVRFGYSGYSGPLASATTLQCTARVDACVAGTNLSPYAFASEAFTETSCTSGCTINVPAVPGKQMFLQVYSAGTAVGDPWALSVP